MSALTVTLGADISALKQSMASATQLVSSSAKKMASLSAAGLKIGLGAALAGGGVALAAGIKAVTISSIHIQNKDSAPDSRQEPYEVILHVRICAGGRRQRRSLPQSSRIHIRFVLLCVMEYARAWQDLQDSSAESVLSD